MYHRFMSITLLANLWTANSVAQSTTVSIVPAGTQLPGDYSGKWRPQIHFSPPVGFMNDPNGLFIDEAGLHHLYYQYNPSQTIAGNQHWGHATSSDGYTWENQNIAIAPDNSSQGIFSGSAVIDTNNTSGFFPNQTNGVLAYYTLNTPYEQTQDIAYSRDGGYTFTKYEGNPIISIGSNNFRDPKVFWYDDHWVMVVAYAVDITLGIFTSTNGLDWAYASNFTFHGLTGLQYECPNLVEMPMYGTDATVWLMYISINPGAPQGGSIGQYFVGDFNGTHYNVADAAARIADWGKDNYASQFYYGILGTENQTSVGWASNWQYTNYVPTGPAEGWQSTMSLPRTNYVRNALRTGYTLVSLPYNLDSLRAEENVANTDSMGANGSLNATLTNGSGAFLVDVNITSLNFTGLPASASVNFTISSSMSGENITGGVFLATDATQWLNRGNIRGFDSIYYTDKFSVALVLEDSFDFQLVIDRSIIEVFGMEGEKSGTFIFYPEEMLDTVTLSSGGLNENVQISAKVHALASTWQSSTTSNGTVSMGGLSTSNR